MKTDLTLKWSVSETSQHPTKEVEGEYFNIFIIKLGESNYRVQGPLFCFSGYEINSIKRKCENVVIDFLERRKQQKKK